MKDSDAQNSSRVPQVRRPARKFPYRKVREVARWTTGGYSAFIAVARKNLSLSECGRTGKILWWLVPQPVGRRGNWSWLRRLSLKTPKNN